MTIFITESFKFDLTHLNIRFSDKNSFFYTDLIKQHSFPFKIPNERNFIDFYNFVSHHNSKGANKNIKGKLFRDDRFFDAELQILKIKDSIDSVFYINIEKLLILKRPLRSLPWPSIDIGSDMYTFANARKFESYPTTKINFTEVYSPETHESSKWGPYSGFINECENGTYKEPFFDSVGVPRPRMTELRPFIYIQEIIVFIFAQIGYTVLGDFMTNEYLQKCQYFNPDPIYYSNAALSVTEEIRLIFMQDAPSDDSFSRNLYRHAQTIHDHGSYNIKVKISGDFFLVGDNVRLYCLYNNALIGGSNRVAYSESGSDSFSIEIDLNIDIELGEEGGVFQIRVECEPETFYSMDVEKTTNGTERPLYYQEIELAALVPDITVSKMIESVKESFNLSSVVDNVAKTVTLDFFKLDRSTDSIINLTKHQSVEPEITLNKILGYTIKFANEEIIHLDKEGNFILDAIDFDDITIPLEPLPVNFTTEALSVQSQGGMSVLFFDNDANAKPFIGDETISFTREGFIHYFLRAWYYSLLNAQVYDATLNLPVYISSKLDAESQIFMHNNFFVAETINRSSINSLFEKMTMKLFKMQNKPTFTFDPIVTPPTEGIDPPVIVTSISATNSTPTDTYAAVLYGDTRFGLPYYEVKVYANFTTDPQNQWLTYFWEIVSMPTNHTFIQFTQENNAHSISKLTIPTTGTPDANFVIRLKVKNASGLEATKEITITT